MIDHYKILGVHRRSTAAEVRAQYLMLSKKLHPDNGEGREVEFKQVLEAYDIIAIPARREVYNREIDREFEACDYCEGAGFHARQRGFTERLHIRCIVCGGSGRVFA
jgi:DnaJ-class molecular chaperone